MTHGSAAGLKRGCGPVWARNASRTAGDTNPTVQRSVGPEASRRSAPMVGASVCWCVFVFVSAEEKNKIISMIGISRDNRSAGSPEGLMMMRAGYED